MRNVMRAERGAVALLTTIIISILLAIITVGLITLMASELRQSEDAEQSARAFYAAQSGVEDAVGKVIAGLRTDQYCGTAASKNTSLDPASAGTVGWTCQQITYSGTPSGSLPVPDKGIQIDPGTATFKSIILDWDLTPPPSGGFAANFFTAPASFPVAGAWNHAAPVEMTFVEYPFGAFSASAGGIVLRNALVTPQIAGGVPSYNYTALKGSNPKPGLCNKAATSYHCRAIFTGFTSGALPGDKNYLLRLRTRYVGTDFQLTFMSGPNGTGSVVNVPDGSATIDVTAKAGDAFRRVVYKVPFENGAASGLNFVIYSDTDICKNFGVIGNPVTALLPGCPY